MDRPDLQETDLMGKFSELNKPDKSFAPELEANFPPEYFDMLRTLENGKSWEGPITAIWGVSF